MSSVLQTFIKITYVTWSHWDGKAHIIDAICELGDIYLWIVIFLGGYNE